MIPNYNQQLYMQDLNNIIQNAQSRLNQMQQSQQPPQQQVPITQNFQLAPSNSSASFKNAENIEDVQKELVFTDTVFLNKNFNSMWIKNASGEIKSYEVKEIIIMDDKDREIADLKAQIMEMKGMIENAKLNNINVDEPIAESKSSNVSTDKSGKK